MKSQSLLAITLGDPAGIGPEIALKAFCSKEIPSGCRPFIIGDLSVVAHAQSFTGTSLKIRPMTSHDDFEPDAVNVLDMGLITPGEYVMGQVSEKCGSVSYTYVIKGISLAKQGLIHGVVTNPINKEALNKAGFHFDGHTEIFAHETNTKNFSMVFLLENVYVIFVTTHGSLRQALERITGETIYKKINLLHTALVSTGVSNPRIAVAGLNPHAGEGGLFGDEEILHIQPAVDRAKKEGLHITGPLPPDTVFMRAFKGEFDGVVSMLHDHGFVALKSKDFEHGVNITVGLPIIRTSVGHGTAFDIAGTGKASEKSLIAAITVAHRMSAQKFKL